MEQQQQGRRGDSPLQGTLQKLIKEHGCQTVYEALMLILKREALGQAALKLNLIPHTVGKSEKKRSGN